jgi:hypothetical protein
MHAALLGKINGYVNRAPASPSPAALIGPGQEIEGTKRKSDF